MKKILILFIVFSYILASCNKDDELYDSNLINNDEKQDLDSDIVELSSKELSVLNSLIYHSPKIDSNKVKDIIADFIGDKDADCKIQLLKRNSIKKNCNDEDTCLYFVSLNNDNGWAIVSGDIRLSESILAYSNENIDSIDLSIFMDYLLDYYSDCITTFENEKDSLIDVIYEKLNINDNDTNQSISKKQDKVQLKESDIISEETSTTGWNNTLTIEPLVKVAWRQKDEYNEILKKNKGKDYRLGCTSLATAQLMTYWKYPKILYANNRLIEWDSITKHSTIYQYTLPSEQDLKLQIQEFCYMMSGFCNTTYMKNNSMSLPHNSLDALSSFGYNVPNKFVEYNISRVENSLRKNQPIIAYGAGKTTKTWSTVISISTAGIVNKTIPEHVWLIDGIIKQKKTTKRYVTYKIKGTSPNLPSLKKIVNNNTTTNQGNKQQNTSTNNSNEKYYIVKQVYQTSIERNYIHMNWGWGDVISKCWYLAGIFDCSNAYEENNGSLSSETLNHNENYSKIHIATDIYPKY